jgi:hypothetical protein
MRGSMSGSRGAETPDAARALGQLVELDQLELGHRQDDELGDPLAGVGDEGALAIGVEKDDADFPAIAGVDQPGRVDHGDTVAGGEAGARLDEAGEALGDGDREAGGDDGALTGAEVEGLAGREVEAGVARLRALRDPGVVPQPDDGELDHASWASAAGVSAPAIRYGA